MRSSTGFVLVFAAACGRLDFIPAGDCPSCGVDPTCNDDAECRGGSCIEGACAQPPADRSCPGAVRDPAAPVLLFTDLTSGPTHGGEKDSGVFVTLYGLRFGGDPDRVLVTYGGAEVARYITPTERDVTARGLETLVVQLGGVLADGAHDIVVSVGGRSSNPLAFVQRPGAIFFVDPQASASGDGTVDAPWSSIYQARDIVGPGSTVYIKPGTIDTIDPVSDRLFPGDPSKQYNLYLEPTTAAAGQPDAPIAYVGYPGRSPQIGGHLGVATVHGVVFGAATANYVLANLTFTNTSDSAIDVTGAGRRLVGNTFAKIMPAFEEIVGNGASNIVLYGNRSVDNSNVLIFVISRSHDLDLGWNEITRGGGESFHIGGFGPGDSLVNVTVHDNLVESASGPGFVVGNFESVVSGVRVYNNILSNVEGAAVLIIESSTNLLGDITLANNTIVHARSLELDRVVGPAGRFKLINTVINVTAGTAEYYAPGSMLDSLTDDHNLYFGASAVSPVFPLGETERRVSPPGFVDLANNDFHLGPLSPGLDTGIDTGACTDYMGIARPQGPGYDRGALETPY
jgi:hypothetical protein